MSNQVLFENVATVPLAEELSQQIKIIPLLSQTSKDLPHSESLHSVHWKDAIHPDRY